MILPEIAEIGFYDSSIAVKNVNTSKNRTTTMFEIELSTEDGGVSYIDSLSTPIKSNMLICVKPGQVRHTRFPFKCYYVHMAVHGGALYDILVSTPPFSHTDKADIYREIFIEMVKYNSSFDENKEIILQSLLLKLIYTVKCDFSIKTGNGYTSPKLQTVEKSLRYINEHLTENLNLEAISKQMSFSPIHFHNTFKAAVGKTLRDYIEEQRIKKAINLLITTSFSLTQIAYECGFSSQSYFSYVFKRRMKVTPREYAKEIHRRYEL